MVVQLNIEFENGIYDEFVLALKEGDGRRSSCVFIVFLETSLFSITLGGIFFIALY